MPGRRAVAELRLVQELDHERGDEVARVHRLHVDVQVRTDLLRRAQEGPEPGLGVRDPELRRLRLHLRGERGDLDAQVDPGSDVERGAGGPPAGRLRQRPERVVAALGVAVGLGGGDGRLAEQVHRGGRAVLPQALEGGDGVGRVGADDEPRRHPVHREPGDRPDGRAAWRGASRRASCGTRPARAGPLHLAEERSEVGGQVAPVGARGSDVHEAEERGPQRGIAREQLHAPVLERPRAAPAGLRLAGRDLTPQRTDPRLDVRSRRSGRGRGRGDDRHSPGDAMSAGVLPPSSPVRTSLDDCSNAGDRIPWCGAARTGRAA